MKIGKSLLIDASIAHQRRSSATGKSGIGSTSASRILPTRPHDIFTLRFPPRDVFETTIECREIHSPFGSFGYAATFDASGFHSRRTPLAPAASFYPGAPQTGSRISGCPHIDYSPR
jgi:hypothetical protein